MKAVRLVTTKLRAPCFGFVDAFQNGTQKKSRPCGPALFSLNAALLAEDSGVEPHLDLIREELRLVSARAFHGLPVQIRHLEGQFRLALLEGIEVGKGDSAAESVLPGLGLEVERRRVDRDVSVARRCVRDRELSLVVILSLVAIEVLARDRKEIVENDARGGLELERGAKRPVDGLPTVDGCQLLIRLVEDP